MNLLKTCGNWLSNILGKRIEILNAYSDDLIKHPLSADAALCNASFHLMNEETTLPAVASALTKGSIFAVNCWGHSFDEAVALNKKQDWMAYVDQALNEFDQSPLPRPKKNSAVIKSTEKLNNIANACGLNLH